MDKLADLDTSFLVPCAHCDALFQEGERFCPSCGKDPHLTGIAAGEDTAMTDQGVGWLGSRNAGSLPSESARGPMFPDAQTHKRSTTLVVIGAVAALVLVAIALMLGARHYAEKRIEAGRLEAAQAAVAQLRTALDRGDLSGAERAIGVLDAGTASEPDVVALKRIFEQRMQEQASRREQLSAAALNASRSLGFAQSAAPVAAVAAVVEPSPMPTPTASRPAAAPTAACNEALAAMSLCQTK